MSYDKNNIKNTTEDGIADLVRDIISVPFSLDYVFTQIKFKPYHVKIKKALLERDEEDWSIAHLEDSIDSYKEYLSRYSRETPYYTGIHIVEAEEAIRKLKEAEQPIEPEVPIEPEEPIIPVEPKATDTQIAEIIHHISVSAHRKELDNEDNTDWLMATSENTVSSYLRYIQKHLDNPYEHIGKHVDEANCKILSLQDDADWQLAVKINTQKGYNKYIEKYEPLKSEYQGKYLDKAKSWIPGRPNPKPKYITMLCVLALIIGSITFWKILTKEPERKPLTDDEIDTVLVEYVDSLKQDLFDGFYLIPISKADIKSNGISTTQIPGESENDSVDNGLYSRDDVISKYMMNNGKFIVKNIKGETIDLPEAENGIDSICIKKSPFLEYIDNNGLRRVVVLFKDDLYYYCGDCGRTLSGKTRHIICSQDRKYGIIDEEKRIIKDVIYYKIDPVRPNNYACKISDNSNWIYYAEDGKELGIKGNYPQDIWISSVGIVRAFNYNNSPYISNNSYGFQDFKGNIKIPYQFISASHFNNNGYAVVSKYPNNTDEYKYGIIDRKGNTVIPFDYDYIYIKDSDIGNFDTVEVGKNYRYGLLKVSTQEIIVPCNYNGCGKWHNGYYVHKNSRAYFMDSDGNILFSKNYTGVEKASDYLTRVKLEESYYYIDKAGNRILGPYDSASAFRFGLARVSRNEKSGFINEKGKTIIPFIFDANIDLPFDLNHSFNSNHLAAVAYNGVTWHINQNGAFARPANRPPTDQNISQQIQEAKEDAERRKKGKSKKQ